MIEISINNLLFHPDEREGSDTLTADLTGMRLIGIVAEPEEPAVTLLRILAGLQQPLQGQVCYNGKDIYQASEEERSKLIRLNSYVFDTGGLISNLSVIENLSLPYDFVKRNQSEDDKLAGMLTLVKMFNLDDDVLQRRPSMLTKSVVKLVNYIRAFLIDPDVTFIELPFTKMNKANEQTLEELILKRAFELKKTHIFATQRNSKLVSKADAIIAIKKGEASFFKNSDGENIRFDYDVFFERVETR